MALFLSAIFFLNSSWSQSNQLELVHADQVTNSIKHPDAVRVVGNVQFKNDNLKLFCDSALFHQTQNWVKAFGRVQINQGDTLNLYSDSLYFDGNTNIGTLQSNVKIRDNTFKLNTDSLNFDAQNSIVYYTNWAHIKSSNNDLTLTSRKGTYYSNQKSFTFKDSVVLLHPDYQVYSDTLEFNTISEKIFIHGPSIINLDSTEIHTKKAIYDTKTDEIKMWRKAIIYTNKQTIKGDSLFYNSTTEFAEGYGNISINDTIEKLSLSGNYLLKKDTLTKLIGQARIFKFQKIDTLVLQADTISQIKHLNKITENIAYSNVILEKGDIIGRCDSLYMNDKDSIIKMQKNPILWQKQTEMSADSIAIHFIDDKIKQLNLYQNSFLSIKHDSIHYDQCSGKYMIAILDSSKIQFIKIIDNAETIYFPSETTKDSTIETKTLKGVNYMLSTSINIRFINSEMNKISFIEKPEATFKPLKSAKKEDLYLKKFKLKKKWKPNSLLKNLN